MSCQSVSDAPEIVAPAPAEAPSTFMLYQAPTIESVVTFENHLRREVLYAGGTTQPVPIP